MDIGLTTDIVAASYNVRHQTYFPSADVTAIDHPQFSTSRHMEQLQRRTPGNSSKRVPRDEAWEHEQKRGANSLSELDCNHWEDHFSFFFGLGGESGSGVRVLV